MKRYANQRLLHQLHVIKQQKVIKQIIQMVLDFQMANVNGALVD